MKRILCIAISLVLLCTLGGCRKPAATPSLEQEAAQTLDDPEILQEQEAAQTLDHPAILWEQGQSVVILESGNVTVTLLKERDYYNENLRFVVTNQNVFPINFRLESIGFDDHYWAWDFLPQSGTIPANTTITDDSSLQFGNLSDFLEISSIDSLQMTLSIYNDTTKDALIENHQVDVHFTQETKPTELTSRINSDPINYRENHNMPLYGMKADTQILHEDSQLRITLLHAGSTEDLYGFGSTASIFLQLDNLSAENLQVQLNSIAYSDIWLKDVTAAELPAGKTIFLETFINDYILEEMEITSADAFSLFFIVSSENKEPQALCCPVKLSQAGEPAHFREGSELVAQEQDVRVSIVSSSITGYRTDLLVSIVNESQTDYCVQLTGPLVDYRFDTTPLFTYVPAGKTAYLYASSPCYATDVENGTIQIHLTDPTNTQDLYTFSKTILLMS